MIRGNTMDEILNFSMELTLIPSNNTNDVSTDALTIDNKPYKKSILEILISISIHTFIMAVFEIYFYFEFIIVIEKKMFMDKINQYTLEFNHYYITHVSSDEQRVLLLLFPSGSQQYLLQTLYSDYQRSLHNQQVLLDSLLLKAYKMLIVITSILILFLTIGIYYYKDSLKWKHIIIENIFMFLCLGIFEYLFFINIILHYSPVTDEEIKYTIVKQMLEPIYSNRTYIHL